MNDYTRGRLNANKDGIPTADATYRQLFGLDELGNWQDFDQDDTGDGSTAWTYETARTHNTANEITAITATTGGAWSDPAYDAAGNMTKGSSINAATDQPQMVYDAWNRLFCVTNSTTTNPNGPDILADYQYDARHFKISKGGYSGRSNIERTHYYYTSSWQCIEETRQVAQSGWTPANIVLLPAELSAQYVWGLRYIDDLVQRQRDTTGNATLDETLYALNDRQFNIAALTNTSGAVQQRFVTTPYGQTDYLTAAYASSTDLYDWQFVFQGLRKDPDTPFIYNRIRDVGTLLGRFLQTEPLGYADGMNRYAAYHVMLNGIDAIGLRNVDVGQLFDPNFTANANQGFNHPQVVAAEASQSDNLYSRVEYKWEKAGHKDYVVSKSGPEREILIGCWKEEGHYYQTGDTYEDSQMVECDASCKCVFFYAYRMSYAKWRITEEHRYRYHHVYQGNTFTSLSSYAIAIGTAVGGEFGKGKGPKLVGSNPRAFSAINLGLSLLLIPALDYAKHHLVTTVGLYQGDMVEYRQNAEKIGGGRQGVQYHKTLKSSCSIAKKIESKSQVISRLSSTIMSWQQVGYIARPSGEYISDEDFRSMTGFSAFG